MGPKTNSGASKKVEQKKKEKIIEVSVLFLFMPPLNGWSSNSTQEMAHDFLYQYVKLSCQIAIAVRFVLRKHSFFVGYLLVGKY